MMNYKKPSMFFSGKIVTAVMTIVMTIVMMIVLGGCAKDDADQPNVSLSAADDQGEAAQDGGAGQDEGVDQEGTSEGQQPETPESSAAAYAYFTHTVLDMNSGEIIFRMDDPRATGGSSEIRQAVGSEDALFMLIRQENGYTLTVADRDKNTLGDGEDGTGSLTLSARDIDVFSADGTFSGLNIGYYRGKVYSLYETYDLERDEWVSYAYCYERQAEGSYAKSQDTLCGTIMDLRSQEYRFCGGTQDLFTCLNDWDYLLVWNQEEAKVSAFEIDGTLRWERSIDPEIQLIEGTDGRYLVGRSSVLEPDHERHYYIYDFAGTYADGEPMRQGVCEETSAQLTYMGMCNGYLYYRYAEKWAYGQYTYSFFRCPLTPDGEGELLYETADVPGLSSSGINGGRGFALSGDRCCFIDFDDGSLWWYSCDLAAETHPLTRLGVVEEYQGLFDMGEISYQSGEYSCPDCGETFCEYYAEQFRLSEEAVPHADVINPVLLAITENYMDYAKTQGESMADSREGCEGHSWRETYEWYVKGATQYSFRQEGREEELVCLEVDYSGYDYWGGAHGMPTRDHYLFDLADGSEIAIEDIVGVSEEEFRVLAAEYTAADCREHSELYFYDADDNDSLYNVVYEYAGFDRPMFLSEEGVVMEYSPYHLGPYASGYIEVTIPYEELGVEMVDVYGAGKNW